MDSLLDSENQKQIEILHEGLGFEYVRFWGLYTEEFYLNADIKGRKYNFIKLDRVLDFLVERKLRPFFEFGDKPYQIIKTLDNYIAYKKAEIIFETAEEYGVFIRNIMVHCMKRYGSSEVQTWCFEICYNPESMNISEYVDYFKAAYKAVKDWAPKARIGGGGFNMSRHTEKIRRILKKWSAEKIVPDFISLYSYHYVPYARQGESGSTEKKWKRALDNQYLYNQIQIAKDILKEENYQTVEVYVTEWSLTNSSREMLNDVCFKGAYILKEMIDTIGCIEKIGYFTMMDTFSEYYDSAGVLDGGGGIITRNGIQKPGYHAFCFWQQIGNYLIKKEQDCLITSNNHDEYYIVCHNYKNSTFRYYLNMGNNVGYNAEDIFLNYESLEFWIILEGVKNGTYRGHVESVNTSQGSVYDEWIKMGEPDEVDKKEEEFLRNVSVPRVYVEKYNIADHRISLHFKLQPNEIRYIKIQYIGCGITPASINDEQESGIGGEF